MSNLGCNLWQTFDFTTLDASNLAANDNCADGTWTVTNASSFLSTQVAGERASGFTIQNITDAGTRGLRYQATATADSYLTYAPASSHNNISLGFWFQYPAAFLGTFNGGEPDIIYMENTTLAQREPYLKLEDDGSATAHLHLFTPEDNQSGQINISDSTWYWLTVLYNAGGTHRARAYTTGLVQVGSELTRSASNAQACDQFNIGALTGDPSNINAPFYFDDLVVDWTSAVYPLLPVEIPSFRVRPTRPRPFAPGLAR